MRKFLSGLSKFFATIFAILFVITAALALPLYNTGRQLFSARLYKNALIEQDLYERLPGLIASALTTSMSYNPCAENPVVCEDITPELRACYEQALGSDRYITLASGQDRSTDPEKQAIQACLDANPQGPTPGQPEEGEGGMPPFMKSLEASDWEAIIRTLLPPDELQTMTERVIDQWFAYLDGETDSVTVSLAPLKARLTGPAGLEAIRQILLAQPPCTPDELNQLKGGEGAEGGKMALCNPGEEEMDSVLPRLQEQLLAAAAAIPDQANLIKPAIPSANPGPLGDSSNPVTIVRMIRLIMRASPLVPLACLLLVTLFGVRSLKDWMRWWGIPIFIAALITFGTGLAAMPLLEGAWFTLVAPRFPSILPADFAQLGYNLLSYIGHDISEKIILHSIILLVIGLGAWIGSGFIRHDGETPAAPPPAPAPGDVTAPA